eukprot:TRINITY_DN34447_c0_g1_i1.p1 TRINITY_DN34447_c0_g1~~TRINITY_DN34447_c0_g1_i1.p1  ORF type:complete len:114 (+),score=23.91 TRINITY_DN34447_c0_g1_i1:119-460(+)
MGTAVVHMYVRSWVHQSLSGYDQQEVEAIANLLLTPGYLTSAYTALPCSRTYLASDALASTVTTSLTTNTPNPLTETFFTTQLYALTAALYIEQGLPTALDFLSTHIRPRLLD